MSEVRDTRKDYRYRMRDLINKVLEKGGTISRQSIVSYEKSGIIPEAEKDASFNRIYTLEQIEEYANLIIDRKKEWSANRKPFRAVVQ